MKKLILFVLIMVHTASYGQQCLITDAGGANNMVYSSQSLNVLSGNIMYNATGPASSACGWTPVGITGNSCSICTGVLPVCIAGVCTCVLGTIYNGYEANSFTVVDCNLDAYSSSLVLISGILALLVIRKNKS